MSESSHPNHPSDLRRRALAILAGEPLTAEDLEPEQIQRLLFELQVHQVELQLQNEELRTAQVELEESHLRYADLYEYAPVGYLTLDPYGVIKEANTTAADLLGAARRTLLGRPLQQFAITGDRDRVYLHLRRLFNTHLAQRDELRLLHPDEPEFWAQIDSVLVDPDDGAPALCRTTLLDISDRRLAEQARLRSALVEHSGDPIIGLAPDETITSWNPAARDLFGYTVEEMSGRPIARLFESERGLLFDPQRLAVGPVAAELEAHTADRRALFVAVTASPLRSDQGKLNGISLTVRDITARRLAETAEHQQRTFAEALAKVAQALNRTLQLDEVLDLILDGLERVVAHDLAEIMLFVEGIGRIVRSKGYANRGLAEKVAGLEFVVADTPNLACLADSDEPLVIADVAQHQGWIQVFERVGLRSYVGAPIRVEDETIGCINLMSTTPGFYSARDAEHLRAFADHAAIAIHNAQLFAQAEEAAVLRERNRLARDLHDAVTQTLFSASLLAELLPNMVVKNPDALPGHLHSLHLLTRSALAEMRTLLLELRPEGLERQSLPDLLQQLIDAVRGRRQIEASLTVCDPCDVPPEVRLAFFRVAQEALNNVAKHSKASEVSVALSDDAAQLALVIEDNGVGFDVTQKGRGMGLESMHERADAVGAALAIAQANGGGTRVTLAWRRAPSRKRIP